jgi:hypothetical protein
MANLEAVALESLDERLGDGEIVLHDQQTHGATVAQLAGKRGDLYRTIAFTRFGSGSVPPTFSACPEELDRSD